MKKVLGNTEIGVKYVLVIISLFLGLLSFAFMSIAPKVWDDMVIFFFLPYIPLIGSLVLSWDFFFEEKIVHKIFGAIFVVCALFWVYISLKQIGFPF